MIYFSIHDIVGVSVNDNYKWADTLICNIPLFNTDDKGFINCPSKIHINYSKKIDIVDYYEVVPFIFINKRKKSLYDKKYGAQITKTDDGYIIDCSQECNEWLMMILEYCLLENNATFIHSAAVEKDGIAYVFPSWGGVGKTASIAKLVKKEGYNLLGDDLVIITSDGMVKAFPKKFVLYSYHKKLFEETMKKNNAHLIGGVMSRMLSKFIPLIKSMLRLIPGLLAFARRHNPQSKRISPYEIFGENAISFGGKVRSFTWLERMHIDKTKVVSSDNYQMCSKALTITIHELFDGRIQEFMIGVCSEIFEYNFLFDNSIKFLCTSLNQAIFEQLLIPVNYDIEDVSNDVVKYTIEKGCK